MAYVAFGYNPSMQKLTPLAPIDYLVVGHITKDITQEKPQLGGTATYSALTAKSIGLKVGVVTAWGEELPLGALQDIPIVSVPTESSTVFKNIQTPDGRVQYINNVAPKINRDLIPDAWRTASIVHLGPVAQEVDPNLIEYFSDSLVCVTPQGWYRGWDEDGLVSFSPWTNASTRLKNAGCVVLSIEDLNSDDTFLEELTSSCPVMAVTEADKGVRLFWHGDVRRFHPPQMGEKDTTGAGDIFAAAFFIRLLTTRDPWEAARYATQLAAKSVERFGLNGIPTQEEAKSCMQEVFEL